MGLKPATWCFELTGFSSIQISGSLLKIDRRESETDSSVGAPITIFTEIPNANPSDNHKHHEQLFVYAGAHVITRIQYLMPRTPLLIKMLESKFTGPKSERSEEAWNKSLNLKWALVDLAKVRPGELEQSNPMVPLKEIKKKNVSELLEEMRLQGSGVGNENSKPVYQNERKEIPVEGDT